MADPVLDQFDKQFGAAPAQYTPPPPGYGRQIQRGWNQGVAAVDRLGRGVYGLFGTVENDATRTLAADQARREREIAAIDAADAAQASTTGQQIAGRVVGGVVGAVPYIAAGPGAVPAAVLGAAANSDQGVGGMATGALQSGLTAKLAAVGGDALTRLAEKIPMASSIPEFFKRAGVGATVGGATGAAQSSGDPIEAAAQGIVGGALGAAQRTGKPRNATDQQAADWLQAAVGKTGNKTTHPAVESFLQVLDPIRQTAKVLGLNPKSMTMQDLENVVRETGKQYENEYQSYLDPIRQNRVYPTAVRDAIEKSITSAERDGVTEDTGDIGKRLQARANEYAKEMSLQHLEDIRRSLFERRTGRSAEAVAERTQADTRADRIAESAIKDILYAAADQEAQKAGKSPGYVRETLKTNQHHLLELSDALLPVVKEKVENAAIRRGTPFIQQGNVTLAAHPSGSLVGSIHGLMGMLFGDPQSLASANKRIQSAFRPPSGPGAGRRNSLVPPFAASGWADRNKQGSFLSSEDHTPEQKEFLRSMGAAFPTSTPPAVQ